MKFRIAFVALTATCLLAPAALAKQGDPIPGVDVELEQIPSGNQVTLPERTAVVVHPVAELAGGCWRIDERRVSLLLERSRANKVEVTRARLLSQLAVFARGMGHHTGKGLVANGGLSYRVALTCTPATEKGLTCALVQSATLPPRARGAKGGQVKYGQCWFAPGVRRGSGSK